MNADLTTPEKTAQPHVETPESQIPRHKASAQLSGTGLCRLLDLEPVR